MFILRKVAMLVGKDKDLNTPEILPCTGASVDTREKLSNHRKLLSIRDIGTLQM